MKILSKAKYEKACEFIALHGRPLDREYFDYWRGKGDKERVLQELEAYRNEDGGFGKELEPDFRLEESSPMATTIALQYINKIQVSSDHPFIKVALHYLLNTYQSEKKGWQAVPNSVNHVPCAPWWQVPDSEISYSANPDAEIVGYLLNYNVQHHITTEALNRVMNHLHDLNEYEIHEVQCYLRLAKLAGGDTQQKILQMIERKLPYLIDGPETWDQYGVQPITLVDSDQSTFAKELNQELNVNLDYLIDKQHSNGSWEPTWEWGQYEDSWEVAKKEWQGILTVKHLITLSKFGRVERSTV